MSIYKKKNLHEHVYNYFILKHENLEATKMSFNRWINKLRYICTVEHYSTIKRNMSLSHRKIWRNLKCVLLSNRNQSEKAPYYIVPIIWHSWETLKNNDCQRLGEKRERWIGENWFLGWRNYSVWYCNDRCMAIYIYQTPWNSTAQTV